MPKLNAAAEKAVDGNRVPWPRRVAASLMLPREHGAWAMLLMPYLVGTLVAGWGGWSSLLLVVAILALFAGSRPLEVALQHAGRPHVSLQGETIGVTAAVRDYGAENREIRRRAIVHLAVDLGLGAAAGLLLLIAFRRWDLMAIGLVAGAALALQLPLKRLRWDRGWPARLLSIAALSATGPAAYYASSGALGHQAVAVWWLSFLYSGASVFYVRLVYQPPARLKSGIAQEQRSQAGRQLLIYLSSAVLSVVPLAAVGWMPLLALVALLPTFAKGIWAWANPDYRPTLKQVGMAEIGHSSLFALLAVVTIASWRIG